ncbi:hypothetical protein HFN98_18035 [Rhizobium laguerreae]|uniref:hypothetical protein n=1 Tax=Rhizobium laguerreae TaxID=1076926 RepID=UPI001C92A34F|nr:hypothetical protein [Rhizobium laguerreae]MBY3332510.1 hypothetical protein [Rhizobium laguerreae]
MTTASDEEQIAAWDVYKAAKVKADTSLDFRDGRTAALAWNAFTALFVERQPPAPFDLLPHHNVAIFPGSMPAVSERRSSHER